MTSLRASLRILLGGAAVTLAAAAAIGCGPSSANPDQTVINYRQVGACNGWQEGEVTHSAGPNAAYVIFKVSTINNERSTKDFPFDPERLFVFSGLAPHVDTSLSLPLGVFELIPATIPRNRLVGLNGYAGAVVETANPNGAVEANQTSYFLAYEAAPGDPAVTVVKENREQTSWPITENCTAIQLM